MKEYTIERMIRLRCKAAACFAERVNHRFCEEHEAQYRQGRRVPTADVEYCSVEVCENPVLARGCCRKHYYRLLRYGDPEGGVQGMPPVSCDTHGCGGRAKVKGPNRGLCQRCVDRRKREERGW